MVGSDFDSAAEAAARLLAASRFPVIAGLVCDVAGAVAAIRLAERLGGAVDHMAAESSLRDQAVLHDLGLMLVSPGEARQRADTFLVVGDAPLTSWPGLADFLFAAGPTHFSNATPPRRVVTLSSRGLAAPHDGCTVSWLKYGPAEISAQLAVLRARAKSHPVASDFDSAETDRIAALLLAAKFGVAIWSPAEIDALAIEMLMGLVKDLNAETRWSGLSVASDATVAGCTMAAGWMTSLPLRTGFPQGHAAHDPWRFDARRLVESGEADAVVWVSAFGDPPPEWLGKVPVILVSDVLGPATFPVGRPGVDHDAILYDNRTGTLVRLQVSTPRSIPTVADALGAIAAKLPIP
jgi:formylmethanofuran dehydrogenase subunit B